MDAAKGVAVVDGVWSRLADAQVPVTDLAFLRGFAVFDAMRAEGGQVPELDAHLDRFDASCRAVGLEPPPREVLASELQEAARRVGDDAVVRCTLTGSGRRIVLGWPLDRSRFNQPVRCATGEQPHHGVISGAVKHQSRLDWLVAVQRSGVDEVLLVDQAGLFTEGTTAAVLAVIDGALWTAPFDGRILQSTTCEAVLRRALALGVRVVREGPPAAGPWDALYIASTTRKLAPVVELDGRALPVWDPIGRLLADLPA